MSQIHQTLEFDDLEPQTVKFTIKNKNYMIKEATEAQAVKYQNARIRSAKFGPDGKPVGFDNVGDLEPLLVALCTVELINQPNGTVSERQVKTDEVCTWPARKVRKIFKEAERISGLMEDDTEEGLTEQIKSLQDRLDSIKSKKSGNTEGNSPNATIDTSE